MLISMGLGSVTIVTEVQAGSQTVDMPLLDCLSACTSVLAVILAVY